MDKMELCEECVCAPVCSIFRATGGLARCVMFRSSRVETKPIVHARWIKINPKKDVEGWIEYDYKCSTCDEISWEEHNYCPHCGAQMDEEET